MGERSFASRSDVPLSISTVPLLLPFVREFEDGRLPNSRVGSRTCFSQLRELHQAGDRGLALEAQFAHYARVGPHLIVTMHGSCRGQLLPYRGDLLKRTLAARGACDRTSQEESDAEVLHI